MEVSLNKIEMATLVLHMSLMRKNIKKVFKSNYGKKDGKELLNVYDSIKDLLVDQLDQLENSVKESENIFILNEHQYSMLIQFLNSYLLEIELEIEGNNIREENKQHINILSRIKEKLSKLVVVNE